MAATVPSKESRCRSVKVKACTVAAIFAYKNPLNVQRLIATSVEHKFVFSAHCVIPLTQRKAMTPDQTDLQVVKHKQVIPYLQFDMFQPTDFNLRALVEKPRRKTHLGK